MAECQGQCGKFRICIDCHGTFLTDWLNVLMRLRKSSLPRKQQNSITICMCLAVHLISNKHNNTGEKHKKCNSYSSDKSNLHDICVLGVLLSYHADGQHTQYNRPHTVDDN